VAEVGVLEVGAAGHELLHVLHVERVDELRPQLVEHDLHDPGGLVPPRAVRRRRTCVRAGGRERRARHRDERDDRGRRDCEPEP
jgi:hypothetical protein